VNMSWTLQIVVAIYWDHYSEHTQFCVCLTDVRGMRWRSWLRHCAESRKVAGSIPDDVFGNFH
jgi:hypothetical protein